LRMNNRPVGGHSSQTSQTHPINMIFTISIIIIKSSLEPEISQLSNCTKHHSYIVAPEDIFRGPHKGRTYIVAPEDSFRGPHKGRTSPAGQPQGLLPSPSCCRLTFAATASPACRA
jgi:hypothetical protein